MKPETQRLWAARAGGFLFTVLGICALGALLGAVVFPIAGRLGGSYKTVSELIVIGAKTGGFFFMVWAPGLALVRMFIRAAKARRPDDAGEKPGARGRATPLQDPS